MASIRRTLSPVPRPGTSLGGETCSVSSPLSKSSACTHNYPPSNVFSSSSLSSLDYLVYRVQAFALSLFSKRPSRPLDRPKSKGQTWKSVLLHFFICFMVGVFIGLTPLISTNFSTNLMSKNQVFSFEVISPIGKAHIYDVMLKNMTPLLQSQTMNHNATLEPNLMKRELMNGFSDESFVTLPLSQGSDMVLQKLLIVVTTTYVRPFQAYYMTRLADTLKLVPPPLLWIVVDMESQFAETSDILRRTGVVYRHLVCKMNLSGVKDRGVHQRNVALSHIEIHRLDGIVYFADDENIYSADLFEQMRQISLFGTWMVTKLTEGNSEPNLEGPICNGTQVIGWHTNEMTRIPRRFHAEISGFAFNSTTLWDSKRWHRPTLEPIRQLDTVKEGFRVSAFIEQIVEDESQMECFPQDSSRIMVWNLHVESSYSYPSEWFMKHNLDAIAPLA